MDKEITLAPRERQVLIGIASSVNRKQIALDLGISVRTVEAYVRRLKDKLERYDVAALTRYAIQHKMIGVEK